MRIFREGKAAVKTLVLALAILSCTAESPSAPARAKLEVVPARFGSLNGYSEATSITVFTYNGSYTISTATNELIGAEGRITNLPADLVAQVATVFQHIVDDLPSQLEAALAGNPGGYGGSGGPCDPECQYDIQGVQRRNQPTTKNKEPHSRPVNPRAAGYFKPISLPAATHRRNAPPVASTSAATIGYCDDLAIEMLHTTSRWRNHRTTADSALVRWMTWVLNGMQVRNYQDISDMNEILKYRMALELIMRDQVKLEYLGIRYDLYNCWNYDNGHWTPESGGQTMPGPSMGGGTTEYGWIRRERAVYDSEGFIIGYVDTWEYIFAA